MLSKAIAWSLCIGIIGVSLAVVIAAAGFSLNASGGSNQKIKPRQACDINWDGKCTGLDYNTAVRSLETCNGQEGYVRFADANRDGCVSEDDIEQLFPSIK